MSDLPTPNEAARNALAEGAADFAASRFRRELRSRLPRVLHPLIPGQGGTVKEAAEHEAKKAASRMVSNILWSLFFFVIFGSALGAVAVFLLVVAVYVVLSM